MVPTPARTTASSLIAETGMLLSRVPAVTSTRVPGATFAAAAIGCTASPWRTYRAFWATSRPGLSLRTTPGSSPLVSTGRPARNSPIACRTPLAFVVATAGSSLPAATAAQSSAAACSSIVLSSGSAIGSISAIPAGCGRTRSGSAASSAYRPPSLCPAMSSASGRVSGCAPST